MAYVITNAEAKRRYFEGAVNFPLIVLTIEEALKREGIYLDQDAPEVKTSQLFEERAVKAVNEALKNFITLSEGLKDLSIAAKILEKIQIAEAETERAAFILHKERARKCAEITCQIAAQAREIFRDLKERHAKKKAA